MAGGRFSKHLAVERATRGAFGWRCRLKIRRIRTFHDETTAGISGTRLAEARDAWVFGIGSAARFRSGEILKKSLPGIFTVA